MTGRTRKRPPKRDAERMAAYVQRLAGALTEGGVPRMPARVFALLLCGDDGSATAAELAEQLQVSAAAISGAVRYLQQVGLIAREREIGGRRDVYRLYNDLWYEALGDRDQLLARWTVTFDDGAAVLGAGTAAGKRFEETSRFMAFMRAELPLMMQRWHDSEAGR
ncbi:MAG: GbsR/MarR family transcriptional regulator [Jatrophihabitans sp.]